MVEIAYIFAGGMPGAYNVHYSDGTARINVRAGIGWDAVLAAAEAAMARGMTVRPVSEYPAVFPPSAADGEEG